MALEKLRRKLNPPDEKLIREHMPLVKIIARRVLRRLPPSVSHDDLLGAGTLGLVDSVVRRRGNDMDSFECYTRIRIRGAIFDELRSHDWLPRRARSVSQDSQEGVPTPVAVIHLEDLPKGAEKTPVDQTDNWNPAVALAKKRLVDLLKKELSRLQKRDQLVVRLYYFRGMGLKEIGRFLGVSEARVSQIHHRALEQLKPKLRSAA